MPSRNYNMTSASLPELSQIIRLEPENEPWCVGYAPSQGRRCHNRTNAPGRSRAMHLLGQGTQALRAGQGIEDILEDLAPHVLCKRFHQSQASDLATRWKKEVRSFLRSQSPITSPSRQSEDTSVSESLNARRETSERYLRLEMKILEMERMLARLQNVHHNSAVSNSTRYNATVLTPTRSTDAGNTLDANHQGPRASSSGHTDQTSRERGILPPASRQQSTSTRSTQAVRPAGSISGHMEEVRRREVITQPTLIQEATNTTTSVARPPIPTRRTVQGDCGICLCALRGSADDTSVVGNGTDNEDENNGDEERHEDLVWCKAQCGVNFHKTCMNLWLERAPSPTCPACRRAWRG